MICIESLLFVAIVVKVALCQKKRGYFVMKDEGSISDINEADTLCLDIAGTHLASIHSTANKQEIESLCINSGADYCWLGSPKVTYYCQVDQWFDGSQMYRMKVLNTLYDPPLSADCVPRAHAPCFNGKKRFWEACYNNYKDHGGEYWYGEKTFYPICNPPKHPITAKPTRQQPTSQPTSKPTIKKEFELLPIQSNNRMLANLACNMKTGSYLAALHSEQDQKEAKALCDKSKANVCWIGGYTNSDKADCTISRWMDGSSIDYTPLWAMPDRKTGCKRGATCFIRGYGGLRSCNEEYMDPSMTYRPICNGNKNKITRSHTIGNEGIYDFTDNNDKNTYRNWLTSNLSYLWIVAITIIFNVLVYCMIYHFCIKTRLQSGQYIYQHVNNKKMQQQI